MLPCLGGHLPCVLALPAISATVIATPAVASAPLRAVAPININVEPSDDLPFWKTVGANAVFVLGDENIDDGHLAAMLIEHNRSIPAMLTQRVAFSQRNPTPASYNENTEDVQSDAKFYSAMIDFDPFIQIVSLPRYQVLTFSGLSRIRGVC